MADRRSYEEELVDRLGSHIDRLTAAVEKKQTIVPLFLFLRSDIQADELHRMGEYLRSVLTEAGFDVKPEKEGE